MKIEETDKKYTAFVDVLGYGPILLNSRIDEQKRANILNEIWEDLIVSLEQAVNDFPDVHKVLFSDSVYFVSASIVDLVKLLVDFYNQISVYYEHKPSSGLWMPMTRSGLSFNWVKYIKDPTLLNKLENRTDIYRNPVGPAVGEAYYLSEESGFKGMRILVPEAIKNDYLKACANTEETISRKHYSKLLQQEWPIAEESLQLINGQEFRVYDLPWWWESDNQYPLNFQVFERHKWQIDEGAMSHYHETERLLKNYPFKED